MIPPRLRSSEPSGFDRFFWSNNASPDIRYLRHFFPKICESLPAHRICFVFHLMSHTPRQNLSCFTHFRSYDIFVSPFHPTADFSWLIALIPTYHLVAPVYIMASQDLISQFSSDLNAIPPSQPDRSRTPHRPQHGWHQTVPMFRGPMHFAMTTPRPFWNPAGIPPPPPTSTSFSARPTWTPPTSPFPPTPPTFSQQPLNNANFAPQRHPITPRSPRPMSSPGGSSAINEGYTCRPIEIPPVDQWKPDVGFHDSNKINGLDFPSRIRQSRFSSYKDIEGMDPLQVPLWKFLYQGLHNTWLRRVAYGRETFVLPFDNIGTTVFVAELVSQLRTRNVDLDKLATFRSRSAGQCVNQKEATRNMAKEVAQLLQSWLPAQPSADVASQQRILELEAELAKMKSDAGTSPPTAPEGSTPATTPIGRALQGQPAASSLFDPSSLLISPGSVNTWLVDNQPSSLTESQYRKWLKDLKLPQHKQDTLEKQLEKVNEWWQNQPDDASKTIQRASVAMGIDPCKHKGATTDDIVLKVMTVALLMHSWLATYLKTPGSKVAGILRTLAVAHSCILALALLTPFTLSPSVDVFFAFRMIQTALMGQYVLLHPRANSKLQALLKGTPMQSIFFCTSWEDLKVALHCFKHPQAVYVRFSHIANFQPKFYVGSTSSFVLDREHSRYRKFLQVQQNKFVLAEVALRFWCRFDNFWMWSVFPIYTNKSNFWALEQALIQLWQPRLNTPFIYQFFNCRKGLISRTKFSNSRQFGAFSLWRKLRWQSTPHHLRRALHSPLFHRRVQLWEIIQDLGSNSVRRFHMEKRLRSNETGAQGCYFIRRLANNLGEPQRSYAINAIDRALTFWKAKRVRKPVPLRAPWLLAPNWTRDLRQLLTAHVHRTKCYNTTLQTPSTGIVFTKFPSVMDSLCNHKEAATKWADGEAPKCACGALRQHAGHHQQSDQHLVLEGDNLHFEDGPYTSIATGSLQNKIFPPPKEIHASLRLALRSWTTRNSLPSLPKTHLDALWHRSIHSHYNALHNHITHKDMVRFKRLFPDAIFHNEDKRATSLRIYCPVLYFQCLTTTFADPLVFRKLEESPSDIIEKTIAEINKQFGKSYPWALGAGRDLPNAYVLPKRKKQFRAGRPIVSFFTAPFRPMLNCIAKLIYNLLPQAFPHNLAKGDVFDLIKLLKDTDFDTFPTPRIHNQDLAGFFTSIDTDRFIASWRLTLQFLSTLMSTDPDEIISVKATPGNTTGDVVKGRTCRTLNVTRKIFIRDIERIILMSLKMTQFSIGTSVFEQIRGSPMGSPLSPALCMMVVALSEEIWYRT